MPKNFLQILKMSHKRLKLECIKRGEVVKFYTFKVILWHLHACMPNCKNSTIMHVVFYLLIEIRDKSKIKLERIFNNFHKWQYIFDYCYFRLSLHHSRQFLAHFAQGEQKTSSRRSSAPLNTYKCKENSAALNRYKYKEFNPVKYKYKKSSAPLNKYK